MAATTCLPWMTTPEQKHYEAVRRMERRITQINLNQAINEQHAIARQVNSSVHSYTQPFYPLYAYPQLPESWKEGDMIPELDTPEWWPINMSALDTWQDNPKLVSALISIGATTHGDDLEANKRSFKSWIGLP